MHNRFIKTENLNRKLYENLSQLRKTSITDSYNKNSVSKLLVYPDNYPDNYFCSIKHYLLNYYFWKIPEMYMLSYDF